MDALRVVKQASAVGVKQVYEAVEKLVSGVVAKLAYEAGVKLAYEAGASRVCEKVGLAVGEDSATVQPYPNLEHVAGLQPDHALSAHYCA